MTAPRRRRALVALAAACVGGSVLLAPALQRTDAAFTDAEHGRAALSALRLQPPQVTATPTCQNPGILGGTVVDARWRWPSSSTPYGAATSAQWYVRSGSGAPSPVSPTTTGPSGGEYSSRFSSGLLGSLLGAQFDLEVETTWTTPGGLRWTSPTRTSIRVTLPLLGGSGTCSVANGA